MITRRHVAVRSVLPALRRANRVLAAVALVAVGLAGAAAQTPTADPTATPVSSENHSIQPAMATIDAPPDPIAWTQLGPDGVLIARALADKTCPAITIDGVETALSRRAGATDAFPGVVCEAEVPPSATRASIAGAALPLLPDRIDRIAVIGDTGCRIEEWDGHDDIQACNDPRAWPLAEIAGQVAAAKPDLIIHVGDYIYREAPCPKGAAGCAGSPWGDNADTWQADVFGPMAPAIRAAPWIHIRGNHETCDRAGNGWFRYLDPRDVPASCQQFTEPYTVPVADLQFLVMDTAAAGDQQTSDDLNAAYSAQLDQLRSLTQPGDWLLTHKPIVGGVLRLSPKGVVDAGARETAVDNATFRAVSDNRVPDGIDVVLSGHIHLAEAILPDDAARRPLQVIAGNSGTKLDPGLTGAYTGQALGDPEIDLGLVGAEFGWTSLDLKSDRVTLTSHATDGPPLFNLILPPPR
jgi:predicted phosphodiesterase